jgi:hypothetical protein
LFIGVGKQNLFVPLLLPFRILTNINVKKSLASTPIIALVSLQAVVLPRLVAPTMDIVLERIDVPVLLVSSSYGS